MQAECSPAIALVAQASLITGIPQSRIFGDRKTRRLVHTRWAIWLVLRRQGFSFHEIAEMFGRDHGTILYALKQTPRLLIFDPWFKSLINHLKGQSL